MRLTVLFVFVGLMQVSASLYSQNTKLNLKLQDTPLEDVLQAIEKQSEFRFAYSAEYIDMNKEVNVDFKNKPINEVLEGLFKGTDVEYRINDRHIMLYSSKQTRSVATQQQTISGKVTDASGEPLPGVTVIIKGTTQGTITDFDGNYTISNVPTAGTLVFSFVGMGSQEIGVGNQPTINVVMEEDAIGIEEVVAIGYGREKRSNLTGSVASIKNETLTEIPTANTANLLAGRAPGIITRQNSGLPGDEQTQIRIRGAANSPLILVDGVETEFNRIDPNDIESINILKDASAAVYGARAGNGVILITTKRGTKGEPRISYHGNYSLQSASRFMEHVDAGQFVELWREADLMDGNGLDFSYSNEELTNYQNKAPGYEGGDWIDALIKNNAPMYQNNLSVSGGTDNVRYYTSIGNADQESYLRSRDFDYRRYNVRSNIDMTISNNLNFNIDVAYRQDQRGGSEEDTYNIWVDLDRTQPIYPTELPDPTVGVAYSGLTGRNPIARSRRDLEGTFDRINNTFNGKLAMEYRIPFIDQLKIKAEVNTELLNMSTKNFGDKYDLYRYLPETDSYLSEGTHRNITVISDAEFRRTQIHSILSAEYEKEFGEHKLKLLAIGEQITRESSYVFASRDNLLTTSIPELFIGSTENMQNNGSSNSDRGRKSYIGRINYQYKGRYLFESTFRADGNVLFAPNTRWGYFPSFSAGWILTEEEFLKDSKSLEFLKLRASYTELGDDNASGLSGFDYLTGYSLNGIHLYGNNNVQQRIQTLGLANPALTWEKITIYNLGIEALFFEGKLSFETDIFYRKRDGILGQNIQDLPSTFGAVLPLTNINSRDYRGFEISGYYKQVLGNMFIDIAPNFTFARAKWLDVKTQQSYDDPDAKRLYELNGKWVNRTIGYISDGIFMSQEEIDNYPVIQDNNDNTTLRPGDIRYIDRDDNGVIDFRDQENIGFGQGLPELFYGFNLGATFKNFRLDMLFQGASNFSINITDAARTMFDNTSTPLTYHYKYRWQPDPENPNENINPDASLPAPSLTPSVNNNYTSDFWVKDVTYLRLKTINLSYNLPSSVISRIGIKSTQIYVAAENLFLWNNLGIYKNSFDPEVQPGVQTRRYPITKSVTLGLRVTIF